MPYVCVLNALEKSARQAFRLSLGIPRTTVSNLCISFIKAGADCLASSVHAKVSFHIKNPMSPMFHLNTHPIFQLDAAPNNDSCK